MTNSNNTSYVPSPIDTSQQTLIAKKFSLRHSYRAGAIVWTKDQKTNADHYMVFKSLSRPMRGIQLPGGRVERMENIADTVVREVKEETGVSTKIVCPLGIIYLNNPSKNYSRVEIYYIVRPLTQLDVKRRWKHIDKDKFAQHLECWFVPVEKTPVEIAPGQDQMLTMFRQWLKEHKKNKEMYGSDYLVNLNNMGSLPQQQGTTNNNSYNNTGGGNGYQPNRNRTSPYQRNGNSNGNSYSNYGSNNRMRTTNTYSTQQTTVTTMADNMPTTATINLSSGTKPRPAYSNNYKNKTNNSKTSLSDSVEQLLQAKKSTNSWRSN
jgi:ADP-ribose pyrophosphatase YjhB (NUDIX family)